MDDLTTLAPQAALDPDEHGVPEFVHLVPAGRFVGRDGRGPYELAAPLVVIQQTRRLGMDLPIDRDHQTDFAPKGTPVPAAGWITELQARDDGIWGKVRWTEAAAAQIKAGEYRYLSPVVRYQRSDGSIMQIVRASLTNNPNWPLQAVASQESPMDQLLKDVAAALGLADDADQAKVTARAAELVAQAQAQAGTLTAIAAAMGLDAKADADAIAAKAKELATAVGQAEPDAAAIAASPAYQDLARQVQELRQERATERATAAVDAAIKAGRLPPATRDEMLAYATRDPDGFAKLVAKMPVVVEPGREARTDGPPPADRPLDATELAVCAATGVDPEDYKRSRAALAH